MEEVFQSGSHQTHSAAWTGLKTRVVLGRRVPGARSLRDTGEEGHLPIGFTLLSREVSVTGQLQRWAGEKTARCPHGQWGGSVWPCT